MCVCVCVCVREIFGGAYVHGCVGVVCVYECVEVVFAGQANVVRDSLRVGSESKIILAIKN